MNVRSTGLIQTLLLLLCATSSALAEPGPIHLEAEDAQLTGGVSRATTRPWCSGGGYVTGFSKDADRVVFKTSVESAGFYNLKIRYCAPTGRKGYYLLVNGVKMQGIFNLTNEAFADHRAGKIELSAGENTIAIESYWGHYDIDCLDLEPIADPTIKAIKPPATLCDPQATSKTKALMAKLVDAYGQTTFTGVLGPEDDQYVYEVAGKVPAIMAGDFMDYSPSRVERGADAKNETERLIKAAQDGRIITISWHWNAPSHLLDRMIVDDQGKPVDARWYKGFNTNATTFDIEKALADEKSEDYQLLLRDIDAIAVQLKKLADADIPVLWRPLHESEGAWFWWGAKGPAALRNLWRLMHDRLTHKHNLHNLIWVFTSYGGPGWYPGDDYVDIVGTDAYPVDQRDPLSQTWELHQEQFAGRKLLALSEFGGAPDVDRLRRFGEYWSYFVPWSGAAGPHKISKDDLRRILNSNAVTNRDGVDP